MDLWIIAMIYGSMTTCGSPPLDLPGDPRNPSQRLLGGRALFQLQGLDAIEGQEGRLEVPSAVGGLRQEEPRHRRLGDPEWQICRSQCVGKLKSSIFLR